MRKIRFWIVMVVVALLGCDKGGDQAEVQPVATFKVSPAAGNTTTIFKFNADTVTAQGTRNNPVMVRWDWESDGVWDRMYSTGGEITHRFFKPGTYRIKMEASTLTGKRDSTVFNIEVPRGYSPPKPAFIMNPDSANITNEFRFDASPSKDDEDSLDQLEFRWDFDGNLTWDTDFSKNPIAGHRYTNDLNYPVRLEVRDPQQMTQVKTDTLIATRLNDRIIPVILYDCRPCTLEDTVRYDASKSYYIDKPNTKLLYSWDVSDDNLWEVKLSDSPAFKKYIGVEGQTKIRLRVTDEQGLYMDRLDSVELFPQNSPPVTTLTIANPIGNPGTTYYLHIRASTDRDDSYMDLKAQWDINNDGIWESEYDGMYEINIKFPAPGKYPVTAKLTDPKDKFSTASDTVWVVAGTHETGIIEDRRGTFLPVYYGSVKIGNTWWMQSNLRFCPSAKDARWISDTYPKGPQYGYYYPNVAINGYPDACPKGWRIPSVDEWRQLMTDLGPDAAIERLMEGGRSELHILLGGQQDFHATTPNAVNKFSGIGQLANFTTSSVTLTGQAWCWYIDPVRKQNKGVVVGKNYWFPIRCIKGE